MPSNFHIPPELWLKPMIHSIWQVDTDPAYKTETIIPKGIVEVIFNFSDDAMRAALDGTDYHLGKTFITGFNTAAIHLSVPKHQTFLGIRFQPAAVKKIVGVPLCEFSNSIVDAVLVDKTFSDLWHKLRDVESFHTRVGVIKQWLFSLLSRVTEKDEVVNDLFNTTGFYAQSVTSLANKLSCSTRHLSRKMVEFTGMNTEEVLLYKKYLYAADMIHSGDLQLTQIAYEANFSDQSHLIKTFRRYAGLTPGDYRRMKSELPGHIYHDVR